MSDILLYGALAAIGAVVIGTSKGREVVSQAGNTVIDQIKPAPIKGGLSPIKPKPIGAAPLPSIVVKPNPAAPNKPVTSKPPATTPAASTKTALVVLPKAAEQYRAQFKAAAFAVNLPFTLLVALCEAVNPRFDPSYGMLDRRLVASQAVVSAANGSSQQQEFLATRCGLSQVALIHAQQSGYKSSPAKLYQIGESLNYGAKYLKKCLGLFTTSDRQLRAFVAYYYGFDAAKNPSTEQFAFAKKIYARWQELES